MQQNQVNHLKFTFIQLAKNMSIEEKKEGCNTWVTSKKQPHVSYSTKDITNKLQQLILQTA